MLGAVVGTLAFFLMALGGLLGLLLLPFWCAVFCTGSLLFENDVFGWFEWLMWTRA